MDKTQKKFITDKLIPFILRERGRGFGMATWRYMRREGGSNTLKCDGVLRKFPSCGTVACIGGSIEILKKWQGEKETRAFAGALGLNDTQTVNLWLGDWPEPYMAQFRNAKTAYQKAKVAAKLLKKIVETDGAIMPGGEVRE